MPKRSSKKKPQDENEIAANILSQLTEFVGRNWLFTLQLGIIGWLLQKVLALHGENASLKAQVSSLQERNSDFKVEFQQKVKNIEAENANLQRTIQEKYSDEAILAKYDFDDQTGISYHKSSGESYCTVCLRSNPIQEVRLKKFNWNTLACSKFPQEHPFYIPEDQENRYLRRGK